LRGGGERGGASSGVVCVQRDEVALRGGGERGVPCRRRVLRAERGVVQEALGGGVGDGGGGDAG